MKDNHITKNSIIQSGTAENEINCDINKKKNQKYIR